MIFELILKGALLAAIPLALASVTVIAVPDTEDTQTTAAAILGIEDSAMEAWRQGDPMRWIEISAEDVIYIDPSLVAPVVGRQAYAEYLEPLNGKVFYDASEYVNPRVALFGDTAVLTYNYHSLRKDESGRLQRTSFWNTTEVYHLFNDGWKIIHTHWSYIQHRPPENLVMNVPIQLREADSGGAVAAEVVRLETGAMERWRHGDPHGFLELCSSQVSYFDSGTPARIDGLERLKAEYETRAGKIHYDVMEFIEPRVQAYGDTAVLFYQYLSTVLNLDGTVRSRTPWNCTEVFARINGEWRIAHTHWSIINGRRDDGGV